MFDLGWGEMLVIGVLGLIVLGPQDLLTTFRSVGRWVGRMQKMAREFTRAMNDAADEAGVGEINKTLRAAANPTKFGTDSLKKAAGLGPEAQALADKRNAETKAKLEEALERQKAKMAAQDAELMADDPATSGPGKGGPGTVDPGMVDDTFAPSAAGGRPAAAPQAETADPGAPTEAPTTQESKTA